MTTAETAASMPLTAIKATVREGTVWLMTNHRHTVDGHTPAPASLVRVVHVTACGSSFHLASADTQDGSEVPGGPAIVQWPAAARVGYDSGSGAIWLYGPAGDRSDPCARQRRRLPAASRRRRGAVCVPRAGVEPHLPVPLLGVRLPAARHNRGLPALRRADRAQPRLPVGDRRHRRPDRLRAGP